MKSRPRLPVVVPGHHSLAFSFSLLLLSDGTSDYMHVSPPCPAFPTSLVLSDPTQWKTPQNIFFGVVAVLKVFPSVWLSAFALCCSLSSFPSCVSALAPRILVTVQPQDLKLVFAILVKVHNEAFPPPLLHPFLLLHPPLSKLPLWPSVGAATTNRSFLNFQIHDGNQDRVRKKKVFGSCCQSVSVAACFLWPGKHSKKKLQKYIFYEMLRFANLERKINEKGEGEKLM